MPKTIVIPVTLDTKGDETEYVKGEIERKGHNTIVIDVGVLGKPLIEADITREEVAQAGGSSLRELVEAAEKGADRTEGTNVMIKGVQKIVKELHAAGKLDGIISLGGSTGAALGTSAMSVLPIGVPSRHGRSGSTGQGQAFGRNNCSRSYHPRRHEDQAPPRREGIRPHSFSHGHTGVG